MSDSSHEKKISLIWTWTECWNKSKKDEYAPEQNYKTSTVFPHGWWTRWGMNSAIDEWLQNRVVSCSDPLSDISPCIDRKIRNHLHDIRIDDLEENIIIMV